MPNVLAPRNTKSKHSTDKINIWRQKGFIQEEFNMDVTDFATSIGAVGTSTPAVQETVTDNTNYILTRSITTTGEFEIQVKYRVAYGSSFVCDLLEKQPGHCYFDRYIDVVLERTTNYTGGTAAMGSWTTNRFYNDSTGVTNSLQGWNRSEGEILVNDRAFGTEVYNNASYKFIDLTNNSVAFGFTSTVNIANPDFAWRIVTFRGVLIKDNPV